MIQNSSLSKVSPPAAGLQNHGSLFCWISACLIHAFYPGLCEGWKLCLSLSPAKECLVMTVLGKNELWLKSLKWRNALTMSCKELDTTTADFITIIEVFWRGKSMLPCPNTCSGGAQFLLTFQSVVLYMHETSERSTSTSCWLCEYCFWAPISSSFL